MPESMIPIRTPRPVNPGIDDSQTRGAPMKGTDVRVCRNRGVTFSIPMTPVMDRREATWASSAKTNTEFCRTAVAPMTSMPAAFNCPFSPVCWVRITLS